MRVKPLQLLDSFSVRDGIICEAATIDKNLFGDFVRTCIEVALCFLRQKDLTGHAVRAFFLTRVAL